MNKQKSYLSLVNFRDLLRMTNLSRYKDNASSRHKMIMSVFPKTDENKPRENFSVLFRVERNNHGTRFLIRSSVPPANLPFIQTLEEKPFYLEKDSHVSFKIVMNPIKRKGKKEIAIKEPEDQESWLSEKLSLFFSDIEIVNQQGEIVKRDNNNKSVIQLVEFTGIARVTDVNMLNIALKQGIGRSKSYGSGLLSIKPL